MTGPDNRGRIVYRLARLMVLCQSYRYLPTLDQMAGQLKANTRTIRRDLAALEYAGVPVPPRIDQYEEAS